MNSNSNQSCSYSPFVHPSAHYRYRYFSFIFDLITIARFDLSINCRMSLGSNISQKLRQVARGLLIFLWLEYGNSHWKLQLSFLFFAQILNTEASCPRGLVRFFPLNKKKMKEHGVLLCVLTREIRQVDVWLD